MFTSSKASSLQGAIINTRDPMQNPRQTWIFYNAGQTQLMWRIQMTQPGCNTGTYRIIKNFGGQKVWQKGILQGIGKKTLAKKSVISVRLSITNKHRATVLISFKTHQKFEHI